MERMTRSDRITLIVFLTALALLVGYTLNADAATPIGLQDDHVFLDERTLSRAEGLELIRPMGVKALRLNATWGATNRGTDFRALDAAVDGARRAGIAPQITITGTPCYGAGPTELSERHHDPRRLKRFAHRVARHFRGRVALYSIWNEPNHRCFLRARPETYRKLYLAGRAGVRLAGHRARVLFGEMCPCRHTDRWLARAARGGVVADGLAHHPYSADTPGGLDTSGKQAYSINHLPRLQRILRRSKNLRTPRGRPLPLYLTEFGWGHHADQGERLLASRDLATAAGAKQLVLYQLAFNETPGAWNTGLVGARGCAFPAYRAFVPSAKMCDHAPPAVAPTIPYEEQR